MADKKEEFDLDEEIKKIARKTNIDISQSEYAFSKRIKSLELEIENTVKTQLRDFDNSKELTSDYLSIDYSDSTIERYREKLKKI